MSRLNNFSSPPATPSTYAFLQDEAIEDEDEMEEEEEDLRRIRRVTPSRITINTQGVSNAIIPLPAVVPKAAPPAHHGMPYLGAIFRQIEPSTPGIENIIMPWFHDQYISNKKEDGGEPRHYGFVFFNPMGAGMKVNFRVLNTTTLGVQVTRTLANRNKMETDLSIRFLDTELPTKTALFEIPLPWPVWTYSLKKYCEETYICCEVLIQNSDTVWV